MLLKALLRAKHTLQPTQVPLKKIPCSVTLSVRSCCAGYMFFPNPRCT